MKKSRGIVILLVFFLALAGITYIDVKGVDGKGSQAASDITLGLDLAGGVSITYQVVGEEEPSQTDMNDTIDKLRQRVFEYNSEALVYQEGNDRISIEIPGVTDANAILEDLGKPGALYFIYQLAPDGTENYTASYQVDENGEIQIQYELLRPIEDILADGSVALYGTDVADAQSVSMRDTMGDQMFGVDLIMTEEGKVKFAEATKRAATTGESLAIYYDGVILSAPTVEEELVDGRAQITSSDKNAFTYEKVENLASKIRIGGLKLELEELHSKVVGAQLGSDAIKTSLKAGAIGLAVVCVFMIAVYFISGLAASLALLLYTALVILLLNGFGMTLTLPGIAGIILSIGMAVDANVIIFARIREELATGKTVKSAIKIGFDKALSAIVDGNVTTLIAAIVLWVLGSGSIRGFAQTLVLGIALSMFTALVVTRYLMQAFYAIGLTSEKWYGVGKEHKVINFLGKKAVFFAISLALIVGGFVMMGVNKVSTGQTLNYSLDFVGGTSTTVTFNETMTLEEIEANVIPKMETIIGSAVQPQPIQGSTEVIFKSNALNLEQRSAIEEMLLADFGVATNQIVTETISSTISDEMKTETILAVALAMVCMLIYVRIRFKDIRFGTSAVVALLHDVLVVLAFYAVAKISVGSTFIACMLTLVGYSINATIVIFDRVRENAAEMKKATLREIINTSVTQTLSRSVFTSLTTFIMVAALYALGVTAIREFALPLMVGIVCGTYSSICLAGGLYYILREKFPPKEKQE